MTKTENKQRPSYDVVIVGSGPNGLSAAITLAQAGRSVVVYEADEKIGGGTRTAELTLPGFWHDVCSAIHPMGVASPFFRNLDLKSFGLEWIYAPAEVAHPLDDGSAVMVYRSLEQTAQGLGPDNRAYSRLMKPLVENWKKILDDLLGPLPLPPHHPLAMGRFGINAIQPAEFLARHAFKGERARAVFAGIAGHAIQPLDLISTAGVGLSLSMLAHATGWPLARGGSQTITQAMTKYLISLGGEVVTGCKVESLAQLPPARAILLDTSPRELLNCLRTTGLRCSGIATGWECSKLTTHWMDQYPGKRLSVCKRPLFMSAEHWMKLLSPSGRYGTENLPINPMYW
ncbi:MAG: NAD(P)/FAD-dependent oxidoreductase [Chloroflexi bacterium]|nr:NAD(P)/FAD-dependent oxidoreductase [Chloroflexota bacterium]